MNEQYICNSIEKKIIALLKPNNDDRMISKKMAYLREHLDLNDYVGYDELIIDLEELEECSCGELEVRDELVGNQDNRLCRGCR